jgi:hypothetical protein
MHVLLSSSAGTCSSLSDSHSASTTPLESTLTTSKSSTLPSWLLLVPHRHGRVCPLLEGLSCVKAFPALLASSGKSKEVSEPASRSSRRLSLIPPLFKLVVLRIALSSSRPNAIVASCGSVLCATGSATARFSSIALSSFAVAFRRPTSQCFT